ncbi:MAG TPA: hypothetical protein VNM46_09135, partial [Xanthobacteraceae bacterium]|nr:hypothetical protein [Xanthobacteraceae bacterium]
IRGHAPDGPGAFVQLKLQLAPAKAERRWQPESAGKTLSRRQNLFGALPIDVKQTGASDDEIAISFPAHGLDSQERSRIAGDRLIRTKSLPECNMVNVLSVETKAEGNDP